MPISRDPDPGTPPEPQGSWLHALDDVRLRQALTLLGEDLRRSGESITLFVIGGGALLLGHGSRRPTSDLDAVGCVVDGELQSAKLPAALTAAVARVGGALGIPSDWLNADARFAADDPGLMPGWRERATAETFGTLTLLVAGRLDIIFLKLLAVADRHPYVIEKHDNDIKSLDPAPAELRRAAEVALGMHAQDAKFAARLRSVLRERFEIELGRGPPGEERGDA